jgi:hypothetical protein
LQKHAADAAATHGAPPPPASVAALASLRIAHQPFPSSRSSSNSGEGEFVGLRDLVARCGQHAPNERPRFVDVASHLGRLAAQLPARPGRTRASRSAAAEAAAAVHDAPLPPLVLPAQAAAAKRRLTRRAALDASDPALRRRSPGAAAASAAALAAADACLRLGEGAAEGLWANVAPGGDDGDDGGEGGPALPLSELCRVPVVLVNAESRRKLFAAAVAPRGRGWAEGFGAGPELYTFDDNRWCEPRRSVSLELPAFSRFSRDKLRRLCLR